MATGFDVIVIGLGGMGSATVYQLAQRGQRVLGLEQFTPPHNRGSSHGKSRIIRQAYFEHPSYVPLLLRAYQLWQQIEQETNQKLLFLTGGLMIGPPKSTTVSGSRRSAQEHGLAYEILDAQQIHARFPLLHPDPSAIALFEAKAGFVRPEAAIRAHLQRAAQLGAVLHFEEPVLDWHTTEQGVQVTTAKTTYEAARLVIAPGAWAARLLKLEIPFVVERQVLYWFEPLRHRELFDCTHLPIYIWDTGDGVQFYGFPADADSEGVKIAFFRAGEVCTPETIDRTVYPHEVEMMRKYLNQYIPDLNGKLLDTVTCMYTNVPDEHFVIGLHPAYANVVVASPCSGHGFKFASVVGEILADLAINGHTPHPLELFSPDRFNPSFQ
ncbi:MAG: N-methyl-L-tryptophan oxidase [Leptolyngbya sp. IPPAS B-1204]|nr:N-methyl-L-tryptophan oxidase [Elainella sp. C42_A2020_010]RNJ66609.1 MAG: N-methyl-L-tryptophan oxidase [Leptolyngbya sp. IPPAS B-1204]